MRTKHVLIGIVIVCVIINVFIFLLPQKTPSIKKEYFYRVEKQITEIKNESEYTSLLSPFYYGTDTCNFYSFNEEFKESILVFYFSIEACQPCLESIIESIKDVFPNYKDNKNILLLSDDLEERFRNSYWDKRIINFPRQKYSLEFMQKKIPTLFIIDPKTSMIHHIFPYNKETPDYLSDYLHTIKERFFLN